LNWNCWPTNWSRLVVEKDQAILAVVGENMKQTPGMSGKLFHALGRNGVNVRAIAQGSSEYNISVIISAHDLAKALNAVHDAFFIELTKTLHAFAWEPATLVKPCLTS
jgi:aspartokinase/homoserine dehydrogenase 1